MGLNTRIINAHAKRLEAKGKKPLFEKMAEAMENASQPYKPEDVGPVMKPEGMTYKYTCRLFTDQMQLQLYLNQWQIPPEDIVNIQMSTDRDRPLSEAPGRMMILLTHVQR